MQDTIRQKAVKIKGVVPRLMVASYRCDGCCQRYKRGSGYKCYRNFELEVPADHDLVVVSFIPGKTSQKSYYRKNGKQCRVTG